MLDLVFEFTLHLLHFLLDLPLPSPHWFILNVVNSHHLILVVFDHFVSLALSAG